MKTAIIIGATSGIGENLTKLLVQDGWNVGVTGRRLRLLEELKEFSPQKIILQQQDIKQTSKTKEVLGNLFSQLGGVDLVIVSSGVSELNRPLDWEIEQNVIETNVNGVAKIYQFIFNEFRKQNHGHLVGISSLAAIRGNRYCPSYSASKAFQANYLEALRCISKNEKLNIDITDIQPGFVDTPMAKGEGLFWVSNVEKASQQIYSAIKKRKRKAYITKRWTIIAFLMKWMPNWIWERL